MIKQTLTRISDSSDPENQTKLARIALLGHDIRAAVSDIIGGLRLVDQEPLNEITRLQIERVRATSEVLAQLLEEGLQIVAEETGTTPLPAVRIAQVLYDLEMRWHGKARDKGLDFAVALAPDVPAVLALDRIALERVLANILSNAIKYTDAGGVRIVVTVLEPAQLRIAVSDDGPGFAPAALERLFEPGARGGAVAKPGDGLGMYISKDMADRLGGQISVENRATGGAEVVLRLPLRHALTNEPLRPSPLPDLRGQKVLVAEDSEINQAIMVHMLGAMGADCEIAVNGEEALARIAAGHFDLAVLDVEMPRHSGLEVMRALRAGPYGEIPIVACTAFVLRANREAIYAAGANAIVAKPLVGIEPFASAITRAQARGLSEPTVIAPPASGALDLDRPQFERLLDLAGPVGAADLLARLISDLSRVERSLFSALSIPDFPAICAETHVLIAVAGAIGAERLLADAERLNLASHQCAKDEVRGSGPGLLSQIDRLLQFTRQRAAALATGVK